MIIAILGNVGSGKTLSVVKSIVNRDNLTFTNFPIRIENTIRLRKDYIITEEVIGAKKSGEPIKKLAINWDFWNKSIKKYEGFDIVIDEIHNIVHSRMAMTKHNTLMTIWFSQIRKILGDSEHYHIFLISQKLFRIDVAFRDLLDVIIYCKKRELDYKVETEIYKDGKKILKELPINVIFQYYFYGENCVSDFINYKANPALGKLNKLYRKKGFIANAYYKYYDSYKIVDFGQSVYL